jgi:hypothetical protein
MRAPEKILAAETNLKQLMADVTRAMEKAEQAVARIAYKTAAPQSDAATPAVQAARA